jgi:hypothetical protein
MVGSERVFGSTFPNRPDPLSAQWRRQLSTLSSDSPFLIRQATPTEGDGHRVRDLQVGCSPIYVKSVHENVATIVKHLVLLAEIGNVHVGLCVSLPGLKDSDPLFVQVVAVVPEAQCRGIGLALLTAAAEREPQRDIALATRDDNIAAHAMNLRFASSIGAPLRRVRLGTYPDRNLGIRRGQGYRAWIIQRPSEAPLA